MKFILDRERQKTFFIEGYVEVASFLSKEEIKNLSQFPLDFTKGDFTKGEPLFRAIKGNSVVQIALELSKREAFKLGFATLIKKEASRPSFTIQESSFASDPVLGFLLQLDETEAGNAFFYTPEKEISLEEATFLLLVFSMPTTRYVKPLKALFDEPLKQQGYAYGDLLADSRHPLFHRSL
jgi:hypothetical protein